MAHKHPRFCADHVVSPETRTWFTDPMWLIQGKGKVKKTKPDITAKAEGRFPKFHLLLHMAQYLLEFGSLDLTDTDRWETWHQWTKLIYFKTSGKFTKH